MLAVEPGFSRVLETLLRAMASRLKHHLDGRQFRVAALASPA